MDFDPARAGEANKQRPAVIITNNLANINGVNVVVIPLSSNLISVYPFQMMLPLQRSQLDQDSKVQTELIRSVAKSRLLRLLGFVPNDLMLEMDSKIILHLGLSQ